MTENKNIKKNNAIVDMLLSRHAEKTLDSETMITETQKRVWVKKG